VHVYFNDEFPLSFDVICFSENDEIFISLQEPKDRCLTLKDL